LRHNTARRIWFILIFVAAAVAAGLWLLQNGARAGSQAKTAPPRTVGQPASVSCLGRVEPREGILRVSARSLSGQASIVGKLNVREGEWVKEGQELAILDSRPQLEATVRELETRVAVAQNRLAVVKTGARQGDVAAGNAEIARLQAILANQQTDLDRTELLFQKQAATITDRDQKRVAVTSTVQTIAAAKSKLESLQEIRQADVDLAEAEVRAATAGVARAAAELEAAVIRAPFDARVLKIQARPGETVGPKGILELGRTDRMYVIAEVLESDVSRVKVGQSATITGEALTAPWHGTVEFIGYQVAKDDVAQTDPVSLTDSRVIEVKVRLDHALDAARLIHGLVTVVIGI
jgi:HlyD family secretion protein